jgi:hypothetical protein
LYILCIMNICEHKNCTFFAPWTFVQTNIEHFMHHGHLYKQTLNILCIMDICSNKHWTFYASWTFAQINIEHFMHHWHFECVNTIMWCLYRYILDIGPMEVILDKEQEYWTFSILFSLFGKRIELVLKLYNSIQLNLAISNSTGLLQISRYPKFDSYFLNSLNLTNNLKYNSSLTW